jgi:AAHS family 4-hydroxybenzoate transporter-like MFS transporter
VSPQRVVDVTARVDGAPFSRFQLAVFVLLGAVLVVDGFDVQAMGYVAPAIIQEWGLENARMGTVFGAGLGGLFLGSFLFAVAADRFGRRPALLVATAVLGAFSLAAAAATSLPGLAAARFLSGIGLGGIMPNATALVGEYSPRRHRVAAMMIVTNGFLVGAMLGGFLAAWLVPAHGWRSVLLVGGLVPLALLGPMLRWLPESLQLLAQRGEGARRIARWLGRIDSAAPAGPDVRYVVGEPVPRGLPLVHLFRDGRAAATALLWAANFTNVLDAYFVASWLPTVLRDAGHSTSTAVLVGTAVQAGGALGTLALGLVVQRLGFVPVLVACFGTAAAGLALVARPGLPLGPLVAVAALVGVGIFAGQPGLNALAASLYPTDQRSTGIGAALGIGRIGAILGPVLAAALMARGWADEAIFRLSAVPALLSAAAMIALARVLPPRGDAPSARGTAAP